MRKNSETKKSLKTSGLALLLCVTMLIGTTFAWFTDSVTNSGNVIQSGTLDVTLEEWDGTKYADASTMPIFNHDQWEPGYTEIAAVKIGNNGSLSLKYKVDFISRDSAVDANKLAEAIDVYYLKDGQAPDKIPDNFEMLTQSFTNLGALSNFLNKEQGAATGHLDPQGADYAIIALHMRESAGNEYQNLSVGQGFDIVVNATQFSKETDGFGNADYDKNAEFTTPVTSFAEFTEAVEKGGTVELKQDILLETEYLEVKNDLTIVGNGHSLKAPERGDKKDRVINVTGTTEPVTITLQNVEIQGPETGTYNRGISFYETGTVNLIMDNCSVSTNYYAINIALKCTDVNLTLRNTTLTGYAALQTHSPNTEITLDHCVLIGNNNFAKDEWNSFATVVINETAGNTKLVLNDCTIHANQPTGNTQYYLSVRSENNVIELNNCKYVYNGTEQTLQDAMKNVQLYNKNNSIKVDGVEAVK